MPQDYTELLAIFDNLFQQNRSLDVADSEFRKILCDDPDLRKQYKNWCREMGYTDRKGFIEYGYEYFDNEESRWDVLENIDE